MQIVARGQTVPDELDLSWLPQPTQAKALRYWFDDDDGNVQTVSQVSGQQTFDVSGLTEGLHTLHYQVIDSEDGVAYISSGVFLKTGHSEAATPQSLRYWFDDDANSVRTANGLAGTYMLDASSLLEGLHTLHYQITGSNDVLAYVGSSIFLKMNSQSEAATVQLLNYWFDDDAGNVKTATSAGIQTIDVSLLLDGLHTIHYQVTGSDGIAAYIASGIFLKTGSNFEAESVKASKLMYWFDDETTIQNADISQGTQLLDASMLQEGLHTIHYQVLCNNGTMTPAMSSMFLRLSVDIETAVAKSLRYWFDEGQEAVEVAVTDGVQLLDASELTEGLHTVHYQIANSNGTLGAPCSSVFLKINGDMASATARSIRYWFDDDAATVNVIDVANGTQTLDVADMPTGLHTLNYQLIDSNGNVGVPVTRIFMKSFEKAIASGHNGITKYMYWLNSNSSTVQTVAIDEPVNPYTLIALLPMQHEPIRSSCFHFEMKDGNPMMYAKNDFHVRFYDAAGYFADESRQFIDYSVSKEVKPVGTLQPTQTFNKVASNDVRWYTMQVAPGDTAAFKLSQPATVQVFAPSGEEVFKTSESASVKWSGIHTWENGTYYLAVHDVTGSQSTMTLEYMHMDKYDVVDWDVHRVGNGGCSTITFKGNGFRDLYAVDLVIAPGDTVHSVAVSHNSDAETAVIFDFSDATLGEYNAVFLFTEEDKHFSNVVTVEEAIDIELATDVSFPSSFLRGTSTTYSIKITNKGNMTAYNVPIYTFIRNKTQNGISYIKFKGLGLSHLFDDLDESFFSLSDIEELSSFADKLGDDVFFNKAWIYDEEKNDTMMIRSNYFFCNVSPATTIQFKLELTSNDQVEVWATIPNEWPSFGRDERTYASSRFLNKSMATAKDYYCCYIESLNCALDLFSIACDLVSPVMGVLAIQCPEAAPELLAGSLATGLMGCASSASSDGIRSFTESICSSSDKGKFDRIKDGLKGALKSALSINTVLGCISNTLSSYADIIPKGVIKNALTAAASSISVKSIYTDAKNLSSENFSCKSMLKKKPGCPPNPNGGGGSSSPQPPSDPNDIYGYLSEAGSKFIADSVAWVNYTIEFENDTTFATAAAHTIVIKDTLDNKVFDLTKFMPTGIRIGSREAFLDAADVVTKNNVTSFVKTIDMRPEINAIAQVDGTFNQKNGIAQWTLQSLDPMTMEPTDDLMQGILPVNYNGTSGIGEVMFEVGVKQGKADGTQIKNRAGIVFDYEEAILTPTWTNIVDAVPPTSRIDNSWMVNDSTLRVTVDAFDARSGVWKYTWYVQANENAPWWKEGETESPQFDYHIFEGIDYGFCVLATDSAGNVEQKVIQRERGFKTYGEEFDEAVGLSPLPASPDGEEKAIYDLSGRRQAVPKENQVNIIDKKKVLIR